MPTYQDYIKVCSNKYEALISTLVGVMIGTILVFMLQAESVNEIIGEYVISVIITYICWYGNKVLTYWHNARMSWDEQPLRKSIYLFLLNGSYTALATTSALYVFFLLNPSYFGFWWTALKWALIVGGLTSLFMNTFYTGIYFFEKWKESLLETERLKRENVQSQLNALRNQVNPHFLFNSLNTLTALIGEDKNKATQFVRNFSDFYRYTLKSQEQELSTLQEEINATQLYLKMQEERFGANLIFKNNIPESKLKTYIPTLTLQILVENAIKHNVISSSKPLTIELSVDENDFLIIKNNFQPKTTKLPSTKLGLKNIQERYRYLCDRKVSIEEGKTNFKVFIPVLN